MNCGMCGRACNNTNGTPSCMGGNCAIVCASNFGNCDMDVANGCETDLRTAATHCGMCNRACMMGQACVNRLCVTPDAGTPPDAGQPDAGQPDAGMPDVGMPPDVPRDVPGMDVPRG
jgi:hypothetical protein